MVRFRRYAPRASKTIPTAYRRGYPTGIALCSQVRQYRAVPGSEAYVIKLIDFPILTDENLQPEFVDYLIKNGFDVKDVKRENLFGSSDTFLLSLATSEGRIVVTHDSDFGRLIMKNAQTCIGIIYLRPGHFDPAFTIASWRTLIEGDIDLKPPFILVVEHTGQSLKIRYRSLS